MDNIDNVSVNEQNFKQVLPLISEYQRFYGVAPNTQNNAGFLANMCYKNLWKSSLLQLIWRIILALVLQRYILVFPVQEQLSH